jgi:hypothetical protein
MRFLWLIIVAVCVQSCGASYHLKRAIAKDPTIVGDTIVRVDTTVVTESIAVVDTLVVKDTIVREIVREGVQIKLQRIHDTIRVDVVCPPDTIRVVAEVPVERIIYKEQPPKRSLMDRIEMIVFMVVLIAIALMVRRMFKG